MKSLPSKHCCNWIAGRCVGSFFTRRESSIVHWSDPDFAGKPCKIDQAGKCDFYRRTVAPGIK